MTAPTSTSATETSWPDARLLALDPDLEELFAEVEAIVRAAAPRTRRSGPDPNPAPALRSRRSGRARAGRLTRLHGHSPGPVSQAPRGPPAAGRGVVPNSRS
ncbi:hypothetical protein [Nocardia sp. NPDC059228]|uniref:hypothetical protein n=1 Tax=Nocardia sp. NPDC059228 TaxID=3346777 RepID=UPI0036901BDD